MSVSNTNLIAIKVAIVSVPILLLVISMALPVQAAKGQDQKAVKADPKQLVNQRMVCDRKEASCTSTAVNLICMKGAVCHIGYDTPLIVPTPY